MAAIGAIIMAFYVYCAVVLVVAAIAFFLCGRIEDHVVRALVRLAIVVLVATPVPAIDAYGTSSFAPAFIAALRYLNLGGGNAGHGLFAFAVPIAYLVAYAAFAPLAIAWGRLGKPYERR